MPKNDSLSLGQDVHFVTLCGKMRPATVVDINDDGETCDLAVFTACGDSMPSHDNESTHPVAHVECVKHCPNMTPGTYHFPSEMPADE